jgi:soluble lytic murein transglycosylase-like protein
MVKAIMHIESGGDPLAARYESHYKWLYKPEKYARNANVTVETEEAFQKFSYGPLQLMGSVAREMGYEGFLPDLCTVQAGTYWGTKYLVTLLKKYDEPLDAVSAYNQGSPRKDEVGNYKNQDYVDKYLIAYEGDF